MAPEPEQEPSPGATAWSGINRRALCLMGALCGVYLMSSPDMPDWYRPVNFVITFLNCLLVLLLD